MENTIMEFWQMMWDYNAQTVVMLTECDEVKQIVRYFHHSRGKKKKKMFQNFRFAGVSGILAYRGKRFRVGDISRSIVRNQGDREWDDPARSGGPISARRLRIECQNRARAAISARLLAPQR